MDKERRKELARAFKEKKKYRGIYQIRCVTTGQGWVDASPTLDTVKNRLWHFLGFGQHHNLKLQAAWNAAGGADAFEFEVLEEFKDDLNPMTLDSLMKERKAYWRAKLGADSCD